MGKSPLIDVKSDLVNCDIKIGGASVQKFEEKKVFIYNVEITKGINRISRAEIEILDGTLHSDEKPLGTGFNVLEERFSSFKPGEDVEIYAGYHQDKELIYKGIIARTGIRLKDRKHSVMYVECADKAIKMTINRKNKYFLDKKDSDIIAEVVGDYDVSYKGEAETKVQHKEIVQYYATDWDFIVARAEANGCVIVVEDNEVKLVEPTEGAKTPIKLTFGLDFNKGDLFLNGHTQVEKVKCKAWNMSEQKIIEEESTGKPDKLDSNQCDSALDGKVLAKKFVSEPQELHLTGPIEEQELKVWADARLTKARLSRVRGRLQFQGNAETKLNDFLELEKTGKFFDGKAYVTGINHTIEGGNWLTEVEVGMPENWFIQQRDTLQAPSASALLPGIEGLYNGVVKKIHDDPDGELRVLVDVPVIKESGDGIWARISKFYGSDNAGVFWMPEEKDEVILGFLHNDPRFPIILGSVYSKKRKPPKDQDKKRLEPDADNSIKAIVTKHQLKIIFEDKNKNIIIQTPSKNQITISDERKEIIIEDEHKNIFEMNRDGINMESARGDITINAKMGKVSISALNGVDIEAKTGAVNAKGLTFKGEGQTSAVLKSNISAEVNGSAMATVTGGIVRIN